MWPIIILGSEVNKKGCDSLDSKRACNDTCGGPGHCPAERSGCCSAPHVH